MQLSLPLPSPRLCHLTCALSCKLIAFANACCRGSYMKMLDKLAKHDMAQLKDPKTPFKQDEDREYILRFFAFHNNLKKFKPSLHQFLNAEIRPNRNLSTDAVQQYEARFRKTLSLVRDLFLCLKACQSVCWYCSPLAWHPNPFYQQVCKHPRVHLTAGGWHLWNKGVSKAQRAEVLRC